jgi:tRNA-dihydrouridine synthase
LIRQIKRNPRITIPIFGNGDIDSVLKAANWRLEYEIDGIMIGRAAIGYPWIFREIKHFFKTGELLPGPTLIERVNACRTHLDKSVQWKGNRTGIFEMRRHYSNYFKGIPDFKEYRTKLVSFENIHDIHAVLQDIRQNFEPALI